MARLVEEVLEAWRAAERILDELPPVDPDHETVRVAIAQLRALYQDLTARSDAAETKLLASHHALRRSQALLDRIAARLGAEPAADSEVPRGEGSPAET